MRRLEIADAEVRRIALQQEIERSEESRYNHRLHGVLLVCAGQSCQEVATLFAEDRRTVQRWVTRFERDGFDGLREGERPGRPRSLTAEQWEALGQDLRQRPRDFGHAQVPWDGKLLSEHLRKHYRVRLGIRQCQRIFRQMGFRQRKPRPQVAKADPIAQAGFKKTVPARKASRD